MSDVFSGLLSLSAKQPPQRRKMGRPVGPQPPRPQRWKFAPGDKVGEWTLLEYTPGYRPVEGTQTRPYWLCRCSCGAKRRVRADNLTNGFSKSCGHAKAWLPAGNQMT